jgi:dihydroorotase-like cyclic amidohydrolase
MGTDELDEMGPIDYVLIEWPDRQPTGEAAPIVVDLVDRGIIRVIDVAFIAKSEDGEASGIDLAEVASEVTELKAFEGAPSGLISDDDVQDAAQVLEPGTSAALIVYENRWAGHLAATLRRSGAQLVANGRIPVQAVLAALDAAEQAEVGAS